MAYASMAEVGDLDVPRVNVYENDDEVWQAHITVVTTKGRTLVAMILTHEECSLLREELLAAMREIERRASHPALVTEPDALD